VLASIASEAVRCAPHHTEEQHLEVARWLLDRLLNAQDASRGFQVPIIDPGDQYRRRDLPVTVLYEGLASDGEGILVYAADAAVNLLLVAIDRDLEDAQIAADAVLKAQLESGRLGAATQTAREALHLSRAYRDRLRRSIETVRRDIRQIDWAETVEPLLADARRHLDARIGAEQALREHAARSTNDEADLDVRREAGEIMTLLGEAIATMTGLLRDLIVARDVFRTEQARQVFVPPAPVGTVDLEQDVLLPLTALPAGPAEAATDGLLAAFSAPCVPTIPSIGRLLEMLLAPPRDLAEEPRDVQDDDLVNLTATFTRFTETDWAEAITRIEKLNGTPRRLSALMEGLEHDPATLVALLALRVYTADGTPARVDDLLAGVVAVDDGLELQHPTLLGPDLLVYRVEEWEEKDAP
jgi:hypothetical protein